jgi:hypothetical protein
MSKQIRNISDEDEEGSDGVGGAGGMARKVVMMMTRVAIMRSDSY